MKLLRWGRGCQGTRGPSLTAPRCPGPMEHASMSTYGSLTGEAVCEQTLPGFMEWNPAMQCGAGRGNLILGEITNKENNHNIPKKNSPRQTVLTLEDVRSSEPPVGVGGGGWRAEHRALPPAWVPGVSLGRAGRGMCVSNKLQLRPPPCQHHSGARPAGSAQAHRRRAPAAQHRYARRPLARGPSPPSRSSSPLISSWRLLQDKVT